jgi:5,10-methylenetetrahydromethanopterin reductase
VTASAAATVDELTGGRFVLGIGSGDSSVRVMGWRTARISQLRDYIDLLRPLWDGEFVAPYGQAFRLQAAPRHRIPIYVSATGPNMLQFAGEVADGVILLAGIAPDSLDYALNYLEIGARRAGRRVEAIDVAVGTFCHIADNWRAVKKLAQPYAALYAIRHPETLRDSGIDPPEHQDVSGIYPDLAHAEDWDRAIELTNWLPDDVLEAFCERFCLMGTGQEVASKIQALAARGVNNLYIRGFYSFRLPTDVAETFIREVIPRFR